MKEGGLDGPWYLVGFLKRPCPTWDTFYTWRAHRPASLFITAFLASVYNMIKPMMQNPISPAMELCICCGIAPPVTWLVGVVVFCDFVGATLLANVALSMLARRIPARGNGGILHVAFGKFKGRVTPMVEAEASEELASVVAASASVRDACVTDAETTGIVASSALESPLSVPMEMCCAVDVSRTVATLFAAAVAAAMARTNNLAVCIAVGCFFGNREAESWRQMYTRLRRILLRTCDSCGYAKDSTRLRAKKSKGDDYNANRAINHEGEATCRIEQWWTRSDCYSSSFNQENGTRDRASWRDDLFLFCCGPRRHIPCVCTGIATRSYD